MSNRSGSYQFRLEVAAWLHGHGFPEAKHRPEQRKLSEELEGQLLGDVLGIPGWLLQVRNEQLIDLSRAMTTARLNADLAETPRWASIQRRKGHGVGESYVTMSLSVFALVLRETPSAP